MDCENKTFNVYSLRLMVYLESKGFRVIGTKRCREDAGKMIFKYEDSEEIRLAVAEYTANWKELIKKEN